MKFFRFLFFCTLFAGVNIVAFGQTVGRKIVIGKTPEIANGNGVTLFARIKIVTRSDKDDFIKQENGSYNKITSSLFDSSYLFLKFRRLLNGIYIQRNDKAEYHGNYKDGDSTKKGVFVKVDIPGIPVTDFSSSIPINEVQVSARDFGQSLWILKSDYEKLANVYAVNRWTVNAVTLPFKYRFGTRSNKGIFTGESTVSGMVSYRLTKTNQTFNNHLYLMFGAGFSVLSAKGTDSLSNVDPNASSLSQRTVLSLPLGMVFTIDDFQFGLFTGIDIGSQPYFYLNRPYLSIGIGYKLKNLSKPETGN